MDPFCGDPRYVAFVQKTQQLECLRGLERHITYRGVRDWTAARLRESEDVVKPSRFWISSRSAASWRRVVRLYPWLAQCCKCLRRTCRSAAEMALHYRPGSKKLIKHVRPPSWELNNHPDHRGSRSNLCCGEADGH